MRESEATKEIRKIVKPIRKNGQNVKAVFDEVVKQTLEGKSPAISQIMREKGYSESASNCLKVVRTSTWKDLTAGLPRDKIMKVFDDLISDENTDKRTRLSAAVELCKLLDFYPSKKITKYEETNAATAKYFGEKEDNGW
jgi:hypothetical protein